MDEGLLNDLLECSVCLERLDTSSRVLPCQHTFCLKCLKVIVESHKELRCPECRILVETKVEELPPNVLLMRILEGMRNTPRKPLVANQRTPRSGHSQAQSQAQQSRDGKQLLPHARAMYDYISKEPGDMSFKKGEIILLVKKLDPFWYQGETSGRSGMFPITFVQVVVPLPVPTALCKALYDFRMSAPDEEGCLAFDKGAIITVHRRVDENWAEGRLDQRIGIFPIAFVELNQPARQLMNCAPLNRPVPPLPDHARAGHSEHRHHAQHSHRYQQMSMSTPTTGQGNYQNMAAMSQSHPNCHASMVPQSQILVPQPVTVSGLVTTTAVPRNIVEPTQTKHSLDLIHFTNMHNKGQGTMLQSVSRIGENYDRLRAVKFDSYNSTPVHKVETTYQNVRTEHFPVSVANFNTNNISSDSSSSMNTPSVGVSSTTTPNTSSNTSTCESAEPSLPSSPDNNTERNTTVAPAQEEEPTVENLDASLNTSMGVLSLNESSTATNTSLNVSLPPSESPKLNSVRNTSQNSDEQRLDAPSSSKTRSGPDSIMNFGSVIQTTLSPCNSQDGLHARAHRDQVITFALLDKRHNATPAAHLPGNHSTNRESEETSVQKETSNNISGPDSIVNFGLGLQAALSPCNSQDGLHARAHRDQVVTFALLDKRHVNHSAQNRVESNEETASHQDTSNISGPESIMNFGLGLQAALSPCNSQDGHHARAHRDHGISIAHREKRHSLTPSSHQGNHSTQNRHSAEILATSLLDHATDRDRDRPDRERERDRRRRRSRSNERPLPAAYVALYPYKPQKPDELELKKGSIYTVTERCRDGWYKGCSERSARGGVFPGNYVAPAPASSHRAKHEKAVPGAAPTATKPAAAPAGAAPPPPPDAPPRANTPTLSTVQPLAYPWNAPSQAQTQQSTPRSDKSKDKAKSEKSSISTGVSLMKRLAAMKKCKSPPPAYSMDNPVFEDGPGPSLMLNAPHHPVHVRSGSCPSQLLRSLPATERLRHKERPSLLPLHDHHRHLHRATNESPWYTQHRKSQSLDVTATRRERHHSQPVKERFRCIVPYPPNSEYELELKVDDIVFVSRKRGDGWYKGTLQRTGRTGLFPASFVQSCPQE